MKTMQEGEQPFQTVYQRVTDMVLAELDKGAAPWRKPWRVEFGLPRNLESKRVYRGVNVLTLMSSALASGYDANWWLTFNQAKTLGGHINKGEHGYPVVFYKRVPLDGDGKEDDADEETASASVGRWRSVLKVFTVFNVSQCSGITAPAAPKLAWQPLAVAEQIAEAVSLPIRYEGVSAYYDPKQDRITLPPRNLFDSAIGFYETLLHELVHATGHTSRLDRPFGAQGSEAYAWEELVAEMGSAMLAVITGVPAPDFPNFASYVDCWRKRMQRDPQAICEAAASAQKAVEWLLNKAGLPLPA